MDVQLYSLSGQANGYFVILLMALKFQSLWREHSRRILRCSLFQPERIRNGSMILFCRAPKRFDSFAVDFDSETVRIRHRFQAW